MGQWRSEQGFLYPYSPPGPQCLGCQNKGQRFGEAQPLLRVCLSPGFVAESGLELAFGFDFPVGARKRSSFKGQRPQGTSKVGASKVQGNSSLGVKEGRERDDQASAPCLCPSAPTPLLSTTRQGMRCSSKPTFPGFSILGASLRSG